MTETRSDYTAISVVSPKLRREILKRFEGRCYVCGIEEWRLGKNLHMHTFVRVEDGGQVAAPNLAPMCPRCKRRVEGYSPARVHSMSWMRNQGDVEEKSGSLMALIADDKSAIPYRPRLNEITGNALASIVLQQAIYWWFISKRRPFYKWSAPCNHPKYREGDSWQEELGFTRYELEGALKRLGKRIKRGESREEALKTSFLVWWMDSDKTPWFMLNEELIEDRLREIYASDESREDVDAEKPHRHPEREEVDAEIPHRGGGVNAEIPHSIYDAEKPHSINRSETTAETTSSETNDSLPSASSSSTDDDRSSDKETDQIKSRERTKKGTIRGLTNDEAQLLIDEGLEGEELAGDLRRLMAVAASENATNEMKATRAYNEFVEPFRAAREREQWSTESWRYGFDAAFKKPAGSLGYVKAAAARHHKRMSNGGSANGSANGHDSITRVPTREATREATREERAAERLRQIEELTGSG